MGLLDELIVAPGERHLMLIRYLQTLTLVVHLPYIAIVIGCMTLSIKLNIFDRDKNNLTYGRLAKDLMGIAVPKWIVVPVLGVLPLVVILVTYSQWLYGASASTLGLMGAGAVIVVLSFPAILAYNATLYPDGRNSNVNLALGVTGLSILLVGCYVLLGSIARFNDVEKWYLTHNPVRLLTSWNLVWKYLFFLAGSVGISGAALLFFSFGRPGLKRSAGGDPEYRRFVKNFGAGVAIPGLLLMPPLGLFYVFTTPVVGQNAALYWISAAIVLLLLVVFIQLYVTISSSGPRFGSHAFLLFIVVFLLAVLGDQATFVSATKEHTRALIAEAERRDALIAMEREAKTAGEAKVDLARGQEVFETICMTCHRMDQRLVGPPLETVLPKYQGKLDELVSFIQNPSKKDPDYPPMPAPGLPIGDVKSVAAYLLERMDKGTD